MILIHTPQNNHKKFQLGTIYLSSGVFYENGTNPKFTDFMHSCLDRHASGDWGDISRQDKEENNFSLSQPLRIFSAYNIPTDYRKLFIITEADRKRTQILFSEEY